MCAVSFVRAQEADTTAYFALEQVIVTADRSESLLARSTGSVSVISAAALQLRPGVTGLGDVLRQLPGFAMLHTDGQGLDPQATVRGFFGGGETEYVLVLVDGKPINNMEMGLVNWSQIPLSAVASVEVIRGGASSLYGDAAVGGVLNVITDAAQRRTPGGQLSVLWGSFRTWQAEASVRSVLQGRPFSAFGSVYKTEGFREHAARSTGSIGLTHSLFEGPRSSLSAAASGHWRLYDVPGPLTGAEVDVSRVQGSPFFQFDYVDEAAQRVALDGRRTFSQAAALSGSLGGEWRQAEVVRTLPLAAVFADTKARSVSTARYFGSVQLTTEGLAIGADKLAMGADLRLGALDNTYYHMLSGTASDYAASSGELGALAAEGVAKRRTVAGFVQYDVTAPSRLRVTLGGRFDAISDGYTPTGEAEVTASHRAFSPKVGVNMAFARAESHVGHAYANWLRVFKAATLDQLYDRRMLPVPFPPFGITISNHQLKPQRGTSVEFGLYQRLRISRSVSSQLTLSVYLINMKDELGFSFETFSYANIAASRHAGLEGGVQLDVHDRTSAYLNYTRQNVTYEEGDHAGNQVERIPRNHVSLGATAGLWRGLAVSLVLQGSGGIYLDEANVQPLDGYMALDAMVYWQSATRPVRVTFESTNVLDAHYSTTGFPDPDATSESGMVFLYPAAGRAVRAGVTITI